MALKTVLTDFLHYIFYLFFKSSFQHMEKIETFYTFKTGVMYSATPSALLFTALYAFCNAIVIIVVLTFIDFLE